jgi:hypothetical protein
MAGAGCLAMGRPALGVSPSVATKPASDGSNRVWPSAGYRPGGRLLVARTVGGVVALRVSLSAQIWGFARRRLRLADALGTRR